MPINSQHPEYAARLSQWTRCRDVVNGSDAVKDKGVTYLPKLTGQTNSEYLAYKKRALFFSVAGRSLSGLVGLVTRRQPTVEYTDELKRYFEDIDSSSLSFIELFKKVTEEVLQVARIFVLIDWPVEGGDAYITTYAAESIINWSIDENNNLEWLVISETVLEQSDTDAFVQESKTQYRLLEIKGGVYTVTLYDDKGDIKQSFIPTVPGKAVNFIPGVFITPNGIDNTVEKPPILDIVDVNLSQYMTSADLEHGRHYTALPTPVVSGVNSDTVLKIGSQTAWAIPEKAKAYYLEFLGQGLSSLERAITEKTAQMAQFSTRLMDTSTRGSEAADTVRLRHSSEAATLSGVAFAVQNGLSVIYGMIAYFEDTEKPTIDLNKDFLDTRLSHSELKALTESYVSGAIDQETYFYNLQRGEMVPMDKDNFTSTVNNDDNSQGSGGADTE